MMSGLDANIRSCQARWTSKLDETVRQRYDQGESAKRIARIGVDKRAVRASLLGTGGVWSAAEARAVASVLAGQEQAVAAAQGGATRSGLSPAGSG